MAQFDVYKNPSRGRHPYVIDVQSDLLSGLPSRVVVPLIALKDYPKPTKRLHPTALIDGTEYVLKFHDLGAVFAAQLGRPVTSLSHRRQELIDALDLLITGS